ncbi:MAG TPA: AraC family transcriptional regulator [Methylomirabilota bacterium]|jgi:AraC-like DNA-binding protein|nr:AraC family transcriptional regulator [Methylomirabilota bacterium]
MTKDTLSDLLRAVRLTGAVFYYVKGYPPWAVENPHVREIIPSIMPGVEHMIMFHALVRGTCWAGTSDEPPIPMQAGDVVLFPQGDPHIMSSAPGLRAMSGGVGFFSQRPPQLPYALSVKSESLTTTHVDDDPEQSAKVVCGFLGLDARPFNPLLASLPRVLRVPGSTMGADSWVATLMRAVVTEADAKRPGGEAVLARMSEMLFVEALRRYVDTLPAEETGWLAGTRDPAVGRALSLIHEHPSESWTVERLSEDVGLSRSSLHERFMQLIGQPPMQYLTNWRMQLAASRLRDTSAKLMEVASDVGYESEAAFSRAFKRVSGLSPGAWRKQRRGG